MSKNTLLLLEKALKELVSNSALIADDWLEELVKGDKTINELLEKKPLHPEVYGLKSWEDRLKKASDIMNEKIKEANDKVNKKEKSILIDSPVKVKKEDVCDCGKTVDKCDCKSKSNLNVDNAFKADSLKEVKEEPKVRLINVSKTAEKILTIIYNDIKEANKNGEDIIFYDFIDEEWDNLLENVRLTTVEKVIDRVVSHLADNGFDVSSSCDYIDSELVSYELTVAW